MKENQSIAGVTKPYIYLGSWKALFGWHKEDLDLYSVNYLHLGKPKFWYSINLDCNKKFEQFASETFKDNFKECPEFIRHKNTMIHPERLMKEGIELHKVKQEPGEFVFARSSAYHAGFNWGFNIAEAVNFACESWLEKLKKIKYCKCRSDSVHISYSSFIEKLALRQKQEGKSRMTR